MTIYPYKNRNIDYFKPVYCYRTLIKKNVWYSIKQSNLVVAHGVNFVLEDVSFIVRESGKKMVIKSGQKNVHAFAKGYIKPAINVPFEFQKNKILYDPFLNEFFMQNGNPIVKAHSIYFSSIGVFNISPYLYEKVDENIHL